MAAAVAATSLPSAKLRRVYRRPGEGMSANSLSSRKRRIR
jgi:hypothetical protein